MQGILERMKEIELEMARTQKNKVRGRGVQGRRAARRVLTHARAATQATSYHLGRLKAQLAKLRTELLEPAPGTTSKAGDGFEVRARNALACFYSARQRARQRACTDDGLSSQVTKYGHARVGE